MIEYLWIAGAVLLWVPFSIFVANTMAVDESRHLGEDLYVFGMFMAVFSGAFLAFMWPLTLTGVAVARLVQRAVDGSRVE
jgi:hypothetical protein